MIIAPYNFARAITKSDTVNFVDGNCEAIHVGGAGIVSAVMANGSVVDFTVPAGAILPIVAKRVNSTTTTATLMVALYVN